MNLIKTIFLVIFSITIFSYSVNAQTIDDELLKDRYTQDWLTGSALPLFFHEDEHLKPQKAKDLRQGIEIEFTKRLSCEDKDYSVQKLYSLLRGDITQKDKAYKNFIVLNTCNECEAFSSSFGIDEMLWDEESHNTRELSPYVWFSIEKYRFPVDPLTGKRKLLQGRDLMDDYYFDTPGYIAEKNGYTVRARRRWQNWSPVDPPDLQRLLVAFKQTKGVDPQTGEPVGVDPSTGLKTARKVDDRTRLNQTITPEDGQRVVEDTMSGTALWSKRGSRRVEKIRSFMEENCFQNGQTEFQSLSAPDYETLMSQTIKEFCQAENHTPSLGAQCAGNHTDQVETLCNVRAPLEPIAKLYQDLLSKKALAQGDKFKNVLALEPKAFVRSLRGRYHLIETPLEMLTALFENGLFQLEEMRDLLEKLKNKPEYSVAQAKEMDALRKEIKSIMDAGAPITTITSEEELQAQKSVAEEFSKKCHEVAEKIKPLLVANFAKKDKNFKDTQYLKAFQLWQGYSKNHKEKEDPQNLLRKTDFVALEGSFDRLKSNLGTKEMIRQYSFFRARIQDFAKKTETKIDLPIMGKKQFKKVAQQISYQKLMVSLRQIEAGGSARVGLWFDQAREFYVPASDRVIEQSANDHFLIDTFDFASMFSTDSWKNLAPGENEDNQHEPINEKLMGVEVVNEIQIELGKEKPFTDKISELKNQPGKEKELEGVMFVFNSYLNAMEQVAEIKGKALIQNIRSMDSGVCNSWVWGNAKSSKGEIAIELSKKEVK